MKCIQIDRDKTCYTDPLLQAYLRGDNNLKPFYAVGPHIEEVEKLIRERVAFPPEKRQVLVKVLREQYTASGLDISADPVAFNITSLLDEKTFTVTTGQQIHPGLGPLYVLYKILNVLQLSRELKEKYEAYHFVPVFWMASEDHDLEEIRDIVIYGKHFSWKTDQHGAVGRMHTEGIGDLIGQIKESLNLSPDQLAFLDLAQAAYRGQNLAAATRYLLHHLFGKYGLVVLDADHKALKANFKQVLFDELSGKHADVLSQTSSALQKLGYPTQIHIRDINLFYLSENDRSRIIHKDKAYYAKDEQLCREEELGAFVESQYPQISPNVALRPLYQESILPNLIYVGGPAEIKYWMQLKGLFDLQFTKMPMLFLRTSAVWLPEKRFKDIEESQLQQYYLPENELLSLANKELQAIEDRLHDAISVLHHALKSFETLFNSSVKGFTISGKIHKMEAKIVELESITKQKLLELASKKPELEQILKLKSNFFSADNMQERKVHIPEYAYVLEDLDRMLTLFGFAGYSAINHLIVKKI